MDDQGLPREDFRSEILGLLGSRPDYQELYKRALVDRDYRRTEKEIAVMINEANRAREALSALSQDLAGFNLENYRRIEGWHSLDEFGRWVRVAVLRLGGAAIPEGEFWTFHIPETLQRRYHLAPRYEKVCFDRALSLRSHGSELGGIGHPLMDALLKEAREPKFAGEVSRLGRGNAICARYLIQYDDDQGRTLSRVLTLCGTAGGDIDLVERVEWPLASQELKPNDRQQFDVEKLKSRFEDFKKNVILEWIPDRQRRARVSTTLVGVHLI